MVLDFSQVCFFSWFGNRVDRGLFLGLVEVCRGRDGGVVFIFIRTFFVSCFELMVMLRGYRVRFCQFWDRFQCGRVYVVLSFFRFVEVVVRYYVWLLLEDEDGVVFLESVLFVFMQYFLCEFVVRLGVGVGGCILMLKFFSQYSQLWGRGQVGGGRLLVSVGDLYCWLRCVNRGFRESGQEGVCIWYI